MAGGHHLFRTNTAVGTVMLLAVAGVAAFPAAAIADEPVGALYVAMHGDDASSCDAIETPCLTVSTAVTRAHTAIAGGALDVTVHIAAGMYPDSVDIGTVAPGSRLNLVGAGAGSTSILGGGSTSVITVASGTVAIEHLTITGGSAPSGGGIYNAGGTVTISDVVVTGNAATGDGTNGGGGIYNGFGSLMIHDSEISSNLSAGQGYGGGIFASSGGTVAITDSTVSGNTAAYYVGGINNLGWMSIDGSTVSGNTTQRNFGGGIQNHNGTLTITDSTISGNSASGSGNTVKGGGLYNRGSTTITNSTLYGNSAGASGGAIHNQGNGNALVVVSSTLAGNTSAKGAGFFMDGGTISFAKSIISTSCTIDSRVTDGGYNVTDNCAFHTPSATSITGSSTIGLKPLAANGSTGPKTMAITTASSAHHLVPGCTGTDARSLPRPGFGGTANCDAGAFELQGVAAAVTTDPQSQTFAIGSDATFSSAASGTPTPTVQWQSYIDDTWTDVASATATTLTLENVTHAMSGTQYRAVYSNGIGSSATTAAATLTVPVGPLSYLMLAPSTATFVAGEAQAFTAGGFDAHGNSLGDLTASTTFAGSTDLTCTADSCTTTKPGTYTVTGTSGSATGTATVTVESLPAVPLPATKPVASGSLTGVPATLEAGATFTATAAGFAPYAPVTFGIYSTPVTLGTAVANSAGTAVAQLQVPAGFTGSHTIVAAGMGPSGTPRYLEIAVSVTAAVDPSLASTGVDRGYVGWLGAGALALILAGVFVTRAALRSERGR